MDGTKPLRAVDGKRRWILWGSLALNLVFIGIFAGAAMRFAGGWHDGARDVSGARHYATPYVRALPGDMRRAFVADLRRDDRGLLLNRQDRRVLYQNMVDAIRAAPFDIDVARAVLTAQAEVSAQVQQVGQSIWLDRLEEMTPDERLIYADRLQEVLDRGPRGDRKSPRD